MDAVTAVTEDPQLQLDGGGAIDDPGGELERLLDERQSRKEALKSYQEVFGAIDKQARGRLDGMGLPAGRTRIGKYVVVVSETPARSVAFETQPGRRVRIVHPKEGKP